MWVFTLFIPALQVFQGGSMKVFLVEWIFERGGYDQANGVIGLYKTEESAKIAGDEFIDKNDPTSYDYDITEMIVHA